MSTRNKYLVTIKLELLRKNTLSLGILAESSRDSFAIAIHNAFRYEFDDFNNIIHSTMSNTNKKTIDKNKNNSILRTGIRFLYKSESYNIIKALYKMHSNIVPTHFI